VTVNTLYTAAISPNGKRVRICAGELGAVVQPKFIDFQRGEARTPDYLALNPMGKVPTLVDDGFVLWESCAILCLMAQTHPKGDTLLPGEPQAQADTLRWLFFCSCHLDPYFTTLVVERFIKARRGEPEDETLSRKAEEWLGRFLPVVNQQLDRREFVTGRYSLADIVLGCTIELSSMLRFDLTPYPNVQTWLRRLQERPTWRGPSPEAFPTAAA